MTADDVIFSIMKFHMELAPRARGVFAKINEAKAPDPHTVKLTLDSPFEPFLLMFEVTACAIMPKHIFDGTDYRNNPHNQTPIGTGAVQVCGVAARQLHPADSGMTATGSQASRISTRSSTASFRTARAAPSPCSPAR